jgi:hypothetical protein
MTDPDIIERLPGIMGERGADPVKFRRERDRIRKREERKRLSPEQRNRECERKREARKRQTPDQLEREKQREKTRCRKKLRPFMAVDGEGGGTDELGRQNYFLMCAAGQTPGEEYLNHREGKPLSVRDCLEFILSLPAEPILVGYGVDTMRHRYCAAFSRQHSVKY